APGSAGGFCEQGMGMIYRTPGRSPGLRGAAIVALALIAVTVHQLRAAEVGQPEKRTGDEIVVCGQFFHTTAPIVLWIDPGGYDAYRVERRFAPPKDAPWKVSSKEVPALKEPTRYSDREVGATPESFLKAFPSGVAAHGEDS